MAEEWAILPALVTVALDKSPRACAQADARWWVHAEARIQTRMHNVTDAGTPWPI